MKIKIDRDGYLWLERAGKMKRVECPYTHFEEFKLCGDWCAKFREDDTYWDDKVDKHITVCGIEHSCFIKDFTDERGGE